MAKRPPMTRAQIEYCAERKMSPSQAGRYWGRHHTTIIAYAKEFGIELPRYAHRYDAPIDVKPGKITVTASDKKKPTWSASPAAIERALSRLGLEGQNRGC